MAVELENKFNINGTEYQYAVDQTPLEHSTAFLTSGAMYEWYQSLSVFLGRGVVNDSSGFLANSTDIPTVGIVQSKIKEITDRFTSSSSDYSSSSTKIPTVKLMYSKIEALAARVAALENS